MKFLENVICLFNPFSYSKIIEKGIVKSRKLLAIVTFIVLIFSSIVLAKKVNKEFENILLGVIKEHNFSIKNDEIVFDNKEEEANFKNKVLYIANTNSAIVLAPNFKYEQILYNPDQLELTDAKKQELKDLKELLKSSDGKRSIYIFKDSILIENTRFKLSEIKSRSNLNKEILTKDEIISIVNTYGVGLVFTLALALFIALSILTLILIVFLRVIGKIVIYMMGSFRKLNKYFNKNNLKNSSDLKNESSAENVNTLNRQYMNNAILINTSIVVSEIFILICFIIYIAFRLNFDPASIIRKAFLIFIIYVALSAISVDNNSKENNLKNTEDENR